MHGSLWQESLNEVITCTRLLLCTDTSATTEKIPLSLGILQSLFNRVNHAQNDNGKQHLKEFGANDVWLNLEGSEVKIKVGSTKYDCFDYWALGIQRCV